MSANLGVLFIDAENGVIEDGATSKPVTNNAVTIDTSTKKFGEASLNFNGATSMLTFDPSDDFDLDQNPFTMDAWVKTTVQGCIMSTRSNSIFTGCLWFGLYSGWVRLYVGSANWGYDFTDVIDDEWHHVAVTYDGTTIRFFLDGVLKTSVVETINLNNNFGMTVGADRYSGVPVNGNLDNVRLVKGEALWTENFDLDENTLRTRYITQQTSRVYDISSVRGNIRGIAKSGYIRPTVKQFFMSVPDYKPELISANDDFTGTTINTKRWEVSGDVVQSDTLKMEVHNGVVGNALARSRFHLPGDFDLQIDFKNYAASASGNPQSHSMLLMLVNKDSYDNLVYVGKAVVGGNLTYRTNTRIDNEYPHSTIIYSSSTTTGSLRVTRSGDLFSMFYWNGGAWTTMLYRSLPKMTDPVVELSLAHNADLPATSVEWDNFVLNSGNYKF